MSCSGNRLELDTTKVSDEQITDASILNIQDTSSPTESPGLDRVPPLKPNDLLTTIYTVDNLQKRSDATELQSSTELPITLLAELVKRLEQPRQAEQAQNAITQRFDVFAGKIAVLKQRHEELEQRYEELEQSHGEPKNQPTPNEKTHELLQDLSSNEQRMQELTEMCSQMRQDLDHIISIRKAPSHVISELIEKVYDSCNR